MGQHNMYICRSFRFSLQVCYCISHVLQRGPILQSLKEQKIDFLFWNQFSFCCDQNGKLWKSDFGSGADIIENWACILPRWLGIISGNRHKKFIKIQEVRYYTKQERVKICTTKSYINKTVMVNYDIINAQIGAWKWKFPPF